jgi:hypothetical protein
MKGICHGLSLGNDENHRDINGIVRFKKGISPKIKFFRNKKKLCKW